MKKIVIIILLACVNLIFAQQVFPLNTLKIDYKPGDYYKDLDGELDQYVGIWKGNWEGKTLFLQLRKIKDKSLVGNDGNYFYSDQIVGERKIISPSGIVEVDKISNLNEDSSEFLGMFGQKNDFAQKFLLFQPKDMCNKTANVNINFTNAQKTEMKLSLKLNPNGVLTSCQYYNLIIVEGKSWPINFPKEIILTKQ